MDIKLEVSASLFSHFRVGANVMPVIEIDVTTDLMDIQANLTSVVETRMTGGDFEVWKPSRDFGPDDLKTFILSIGYYRSEKLIKHWLVARYGHHLKTSFPEYYPPEYHDQVPPQGVARRVVEQLIKEVQRVQVWPRSVISKTDIERFRREAHAAYKESVTGKTDERFVTFMVNFYLETQWAPAGLRNLSIMKWVDGGRIEFITKIWAADPNRPNNISMFLRVSSRITRHKLEEILVNHISGIHFTQVDTFDPSYSSHYFGIKKICVDNGWRVHNNPHLELCSMDDQVIIRAFKWRNDNPGEAEHEGIHDTILRKSHELQRAIPPIRAAQATGSPSHHITMHFLLDFLCEF